MPHSYVTLRITILSLSSDPQNRAPANGEGGGERVEKGKKGFQTDTDISAVGYKERKLEAFDFATMEAHGSDINEGNAHFKPQRRKVYIYIYIYIGICMHVYIYTCIYIQIYTLRRSGLKWALRPLTSEPWRFCDIT